MRRRKLLVALAGLAVVVCAAGVFVPRPAVPSPVTRENYDHFQEGVSIAEVEAVLGPPGNYADGPIMGSAITEFSGESRAVNRNRPAWQWVSDTAIIEMYADEHGKVRRRAFTPMHRVPRSPLDNLLWRAKRQWRKWFPK
jgi:hypothetical protein